MNKRLASQKVTEKKEKSISDKRTPEEYFDEAKLGLNAIADSYKRNAKRPDNIVKELATIKDLDAAASIHLACCMVNAKQEVYAEVVKRIDAMTFDNISGNEWEDPFSDMFDYVEEDQILFSDLMIRWAKFEAVRPFGEKVEQLRMSLLEMIAEK